MRRTPREPRGLAVSTQATFVPASRPSAGDARGSAAPTSELVHGLIAVGAAIAGALERIAAAAELASGVKGNAAPDPATAAPPAPQRRSRAAVEETKEGPKRIAVSEVDRRRGIAIAKRFGLIVHEHKREGA